MRGCRPICGAWTFGFPTVSNWCNTVQNIEAGTTKDYQLRDLLLVALTVASGAVDAISYFGLGKTFSAFMTGNIVFLGFGIAEIEGPDVIPVLVALSMYAAGAHLG